MKCPKENVVKQLLDGELFADQLAVCELASHLGCLVPSSLLLTVEAFEIKMSTCDNAKILSDALGITQYKQFPDSAQ